MKMFRFTKHKAKVGTNIKNLFFRRARGFMRSPETVIYTTIVVAGLVALAYSADDRLFSLKLSNAQYADGDINNFSLYARYATEMADFGAALFKIGICGYGARQLWNTIKKK